MNLYSELMSWASYAKSELVSAEIVEERSAYDLRISEATSLIGQWSADAKGDRVTIAKARRDVEPSVIAKQNALLEAKAHRKLLESVFERCERSAQVLSRELSRRISISPKDRSLARYSA